MEAFQLFRKVDDPVLMMDNFKPTSVWACGKCNHVSGHKDIAENCCLCVYCKRFKNHEYSNSDCEPCREKNRRENYLKNLQILPFDPDQIYCIDDDFFFDGPESILDHLAESDSYESPDEWPEFAHFTHEEKLHLDPDHVLENLCNDHHEDIADSIEDEEELRDFITKWSDKQTGKTYWEDSKKAIRIDSIPGFEEMKAAFIKERAEE